MTTARHLLTVLWLRITILKNQFLRQSLVTRVMTGLLLAIIGFSMLGTVGGVLSTSRLLLPTEPPWWLTYAWTGLVVAFLGAWIVGVWMDLSQSEALTLNKFMHLPIQPQQVVLINYLASLISLNLVYFFPSALAFGFAVAMRYQGWYWLTPLLVLAFFFMVTSVTWLFRGWLVSIMSNKRQRQLVIAVGSFIFGMMFLIPWSLQTLYRGSDRNEQRTFLSEQRELFEQRAREEIDQPAFEEALESLKARRQQAMRERWEFWKSRLDVAHLWLPVGWLPAGVAMLQEGNSGFALMFLMGMVGFGTVSLAMGFRNAKAQSLQNSGDHQAQRRNLIRTELSVPDASFEPDAARLVATNPSSNWIEKDWLRLTNPQAAVAMATLRSHSRSPEIKIAMLVWFVLLVVMAVILNSNGISLSNSWLNVLFGFGVAAMASMGVNQLVANQFGFDRDGFRSYLIFPVCSRDLLIGKNMAAFPFGIVFGLMGLAVLQWFTRMDWTHFLANCFQLVTIMFVNLLINNLLSIMTPLTVKPGSLQPRSIGVTTAFLQMAIFILFPLSVVPVLVPLGLEWWFQNHEFWGSFPFYLIGAMLGAIVTFLVYFNLIGWQANLLQSRMHRILDVATRKE